MSLDDYPLESDERRFSYPVPRGGCPSFAHSDEGFAFAQRTSLCFVDRPASSPGTYPDLDWYLPPGGVYHSRAEEQKDVNIKTRIDGWISRLDQLISDPVQMENADVINEMISSQRTLTSGSSSSTEVADNDDDDDDDDGKREGGSSPCPFLEEAPRGIKCQGVLESKEHRMKKDCAEKQFQNGETSRTFDRNEAKRTKNETKQRTIEYQTGEVCSNIDKASEILNTRYKLEDIAIERKPIITWSKWNVSQIVRGPHELSPIWNPTLQKRNIDRPNSIVFRELDKEIDRRNEELEKIVKKKTELGRRFAPPQNPPFPSTTTTSSPPSSPLITSSPQTPNVHPPASVSSAFHPVVSPAIRESTSTTRTQTSTSSIQPQRSSAKSDPEVAMTTTSAAAAEEEEKATGAPPLAPEADPAAVGGFGLLRRMAKFFWNSLSR